MAIPVVSGATIACPMGLSTGTIVATSQVSVMLGGKPVALISDSAPLTNVTPCGMCTSMANPTVAAATSAAMGVLTPMPCIPAPMGAWVCGMSPIVAGKPTLTSEGKLACSYGGSITIVNPGQTAVLY